MKTHLLGAEPDCGMSLVTETGFLHWGGCEGLDMPKVISTLQEKGEQAHLLFVVLLLYCVRSWEMFMFLHVC